MFGDKDKSHLAMGMFVGAQRRANAAEQNVDELLVALDETKKILDGHAAESITRGADRDAWRELALNIVQELQDPSLPRRFSAVDAQGDTERAQLLQHVHRQSWDKSVARSKITGTDQYIPDAFTRAKAMCIETVRGYPEDVKVKKGMPQVRISSTPKPE